MKKVFGISYASRDYLRRKELVEKVANESGFFCEFKCFTEEDIPDEFKESYKEVWKHGLGGGYWIWKPYVIKQMLNELNDDDILVYYDSGCELNVTENSVKRFHEYIDMVNNSEHGFLRFELIGLTDRQFTNKKTQDHIQNKYIISDDIMNSYLDSNQIVGGIMVIRKTNFVVKFFQECLDILDEDPQLYSDNYNKENEHHRRDQSIQSLLYKIMNGGLLIPDETYFIDNNNNFSREKGEAVPFWATRSK
jgi:hypothetical protein